MQNSGTVAAPQIDAAQQSENVSRMIWVGVVTGLLGLQIVGCMFALFLATTSRSMAVIPDYHRKAMEWDSYRAEQAANTALGWKQTIDVSGPVDIMQNRLITIRVEDSDKAAVNVDRLEATVYHHADAAELHKVDMELLAPGTFRGKLRIRKEGLWQIDTTIFASGKEVKLSAKHTVADRPAPSGK